MYAPKRKTGCHIQKHDVGDGEMLTTRQIAVRLGTTPATIRGRLAKGWKGEQLLLPTGAKRREGRPRTQTAVTAYALALRFGRKWPTTAEIQRAFPMDDTTAAYWRNAIRIALEKTCKMPR